MKVLALAFAFVILASTQARAEAPEGADPNSETGVWFRSLMEPGTGRGCCSVADCRITDGRPTKAGLEVLLGQQFAIDPPRWEPVPEDKILRVNNPTGRYVVCYYDGEIHCVVLPSLT